MNLVRKLQRHTPQPTCLRRNTWCGPYAVAAITGFDYDQAYDACLLASRSKRILVMSAFGVWSTLKELWPTLDYDRQEIFDQNIDGSNEIRDFTTGKSLIEYNTRPTFTQWLRTRDRKSAYLVTLTRHYVVVAGDRVIDNHMLRWTNLGSSLHRRTRVRRVWRLALSGS